MSIADLNSKTFQLSSSIICYGRPCLLFSRSRRSLGLVTFSCAFARSLILFHMGNFRGHGFSPGTAGLLFHAPPGDEAGVI